MFTQLQPFHRGQYFQLCFAEKPLQSNNITATCPATACLSLAYGLEISCGASLEVILLKQVFLNQASCRYSFYSENCSESFQLFYYQWNFGAWTNLRKQFNKSIQCEELKQNKQTKKLQHSTTKKIPCKRILKWKWIYSNQSVQSFWFPLSCIKKWILTVTTAIKYCNYYLSILVKLSYIFSFLELGV